MSPRGRIRLNDVLVRALAVQEVRLEEHAPAEPLVPLDVADERLGRPQVRGSHVDERNRRPEWRAVRRESRDGSRLERIVRPDVQRCPLCELPETAAQDPFSLRQHADRDARARRPVHALDHRITVEAHAQLEGHTWSHTPPVLGVNRELCGVDLLKRRLPERRLLRQRPIDTPDLYRTARAEPAVARHLQVESDLEHMLSAPSIAREAERLDQLDAMDLAFLVVIEAAALCFRSEHHRQPPFGVHVQLEETGCQRGLQDDVRRNGEPIHAAERQPALIEIGVDFRRPERAHADALDLAWKEHETAPERMTTREHAVDAGERVKAPQRDNRLVRQALHRCVDVPELEILGEEDPVLLDGTANGELRFETADCRKSLSEPRHQTARLDLPLIGPSLGSDLRDACREAPVFCRERVCEHLDRFDALSRDVQIEIAGGRIDEAGTADLKGALSWLPALYAQPAVRATNHTGEKWEEALKIVTLEGSEIHDRPRDHVARRDRLNAVRRRAVGGADLDAGRDVGQSHIQQHLGDSASTDLEGG